MKTKYKISIDLEDFIKSGKFDHLKVGMTKDEVLNVFPEPEDWSNAAYYLSSNIWRYGNFELHFEEDTLLMIFNYYIAEMDGGESLEVKRWIFEPENDRRLIEIMRKLNTERLSFEVESDSIGRTILHIKDSDVYLSFNPEYAYEEEATGKMDVNDFELGAIYQIDPKKKTDEE